MLKMCGFSIDFVLAGLICSIPSFLISFNAFEMRNLYV